MAKTIGILTGGGDCPGLNAVIRAVVRRSFDYGHTSIGIRGSWQGLITPETTTLDRRAVSGLLPRGGTILGMTRTDPFRTAGGVEAVLENVGALGLDAIVAIGGEGTLSIARRLYEEHGVPVVGVPKTIDNDVAGTDYTFGFDTAVSICTEAIDRLHTTAESHNRVMVVEVMGRNSGWIALHAGVAGGADVVLVPEIDMPIEDACEILRARHEIGKDFSIVVVAEGYKFTRRSGETTVVTQGEDQYGFPRYGGVARYVAEAIEDDTGFETRVTVLGHVQRGGTPTARDRLLATRFGLKAAQLAHEEKFGRMASLQGDEVLDVSLVEATKRLKTVPLSWYETARVLFG